MSISPSSMNWSVPSNRGAPPCLPARAMYEAASRRQPTPINPFGLVES
jgi:hypothetical protein